MPSMIHVIEHRSASNDYAQYPYEIFVIFILLLYDTSKLLYLSSAGLSSFTSLNIFITFVLMESNIHYSYIFKYTLPAVYYCNIYIVIYIAIYVN